MFFFVGYGGLGLVLMIAFFILAFTIPAQSRAWLWILVGILVLDLLTGAFLFALVQGAFLVFYLSRRRQAGRPPGAPQPPPCATRSAFGMATFGRQPYVTGCRKAET